MFNFAQVNRRVRGKDEYLGKMVGVGAHFSYDGIVEPFKPERLDAHSNLKGNIHQQASIIHTAKRAFDFFASEFDELCCSLPPLFMLEMLQFALMALY